LTSRVSSQLLFARRCSLSPNPSSATRCRICKRKADFQPRESPNRSRALVRLSQIVPQSATRRFPNVDSRGQKPLNYRSPRGVTLDSDPLGSQFLRTELVRSPELVQIVEIPSAKRRLTGRQLRTRLSQTWLKCGQTLNFGARNRDKIPKRAL
jgi:hypothetical protein